MSNIVQSTIQREDNGNIVLNVTIPWDIVAKTKEVVVKEVSQGASIQGFRKGKAPKAIVSEHINPEKLQEDILKKVLPDAYIASVKEHNITPILNPKIHVNKVEDNTDWTFTATTCEMPKITLGKYKEKVREVTAKNKIVLPGKEPTEPSFDDIMKVLVDEATLTIPPMLVEQEVDRLLSQTLDEIKRLGLNLEQYLASTGKTPKQLRDDYSQKAKTDITLEFVLQEIAQVENLKVEEKEIDEAILKAKDQTEKTYLEQNRYLLASILRQQKTLDFLKNL